jgi:hypothetical protein
LSTLQLFSTMKRTPVILAALASIVVSHAPIAQATQLAAQPPVLGIKGAYINGYGFGSVKPSIVGFGGDSTTYYTNLVWHGWGASTTEGVGRGWCVPLDGAGTSYGHKCAVELYATSLGRCDGRAAYKALTVYAKYGKRWIRYSGKDDPTCKKGL